jgi:hypothetical protein
LRKAATYSIDQWLAAPTQLAAPAYIPAPLVPLITALRIAKPEQLSSNDQSRHVSLTGRPPSLSSSKRPQSAPKLFSCNAAIRFATTPAKQHFSAAVVSPVIVTLRPPPCARQPKRSAWTQAASIL